MKSDTIGIVACLITIICWTIGTFAFTKASRLYSPSAVNRVRLLFALLILTLVVCLTLGVLPFSLFTLASTNQFLWFGLSGIIGFSLGDHFSFYAFHILGGRRATVLVSIAPAASLVTGMFLLNEQLSYIGIGGMFVSIFGLLLLTLSHKEKKEVHNDGYGSFVHGVMYGIGGALCQGIGLVLSKKGFVGSQHIEIHPLYATWIRLVTATACGFLVVLFKTNPIKEVLTVIRNINILKPVLTGTIFGPVLGVTFSLIAASMIEVSVAQTILSLTPVTVTLASMLYYKEKIHLLSYIAVGVCIIGVLILVWRNLFLTIL